MTATRRTPKAAIAFMSPYSLLQCVGLLENIPRSYASLTLKNSAKITSNRQPYQCRMIHRSRNIFGTINIRANIRLEPQPDNTTRAVILNTSIGPQGYLPLYLTAIGLPLLSISVVFTGKTFLLWGVPLLIGLSVVMGWLTRQAEAYLITTLQHVLTGGEGGDKADVIEPLLEDYPPTRTK